ncbi:formate dehydrogenase accessory protein FdhE, partial [Azospirillum brasilense]|nr:formate dehydrogenase accessory protein FdhE [Azospirillum brasilense]
STLPAEEQWAAARPPLGPKPDALPGGAREALTALAAAHADPQEALAGRWAGDALEDGALAAAPILAAAFQTAWTRHAVALDPASVTTHAPATACPVCGGAPVAGVLQVGMESGGLRYLHCGICHTAWHHVRSSCVACGDGKDVSQRFVEGADGTEANGAVRAETCDACHSYLKLLFLEKAPDLDPVADDLATLALDLLLGEEEYRRIGVNPFLAVAG